MITPEEIVRIMDKYVTSAYKVDNWELALSRLRFYEVANEIITLIKTKEKYYDGYYDNTNTMQ